MEPQCWFIQIKPSIHSELRGAPPAVKVRPKSAFKPVAHSVQLQRSCSVWRFDKDGSLLGAPLGPGRAKWQRAKCPLVRAPQEGVHVQEVCSAVWLLNMDMICSKNKEYI